MIFDPNASTIEPRMKNVKLLQFSHLSTFATCYYLLIKSNLMIKYSIIVLSNANFYTTRKGKCFRGMQDEDGVMTTDDDFEVDEGQLANGSPLFVRFKTF